MDEKKRKDLPAQKLQPGLWVVATPIGNLMDLSERGCFALKSADAILCEDTRRTSKLLAVLEITASLYRFDEHATAIQLEKAIERLQAGESLALVSDAGTPGISDPGAKLVAAAHLARVRVTPIPGASAVVALLSVAGFEDTAFTFRGFFPRKAAEKRKEFEQLRKALPVSKVFVWYESPERMRETLEFISESEPALRVIAAKELSKIHERLFVGDAISVRDQVKEELISEGNLGEWCLAVQFHGGTRAEIAERSGREAHSSDWVKTLQCLLNARVSASDAAREVSQSFGVAKKSVYECALKLSGKK
ncbi:MAG: 16S rRNA (cytidine(1402)-2'-O)-methyltransferase [Methylotenera sp.]|nr:16S rRNA (cytidine(1402)-2'-O)-methyltransferase [Oligoflexia bacterium]